ncbi:aspartate kinase [Patescibacteria group bacterium]|nr:aspartate kinase [Patescibacteria group bacterium]
MIIINKFGGEIIDNPRLVKLALRRIKEQLELNQKPVVVVSALAGVTDKLLRLSQNYNKKIINELINQHKEWTTKLGVRSEKLDLETDSLKKELEKDLKIQVFIPPLLKERDKQLAHRDRILSYGEKWSSLLFAEILIKNGINAKRLTGEDLGLITDENFGDANIVYEESVRNIKSKLPPSPFMLRRASKNFSSIPVITGFIGRTRRGETTTLGRGGSDTMACLLGAVLNASKVILWKNVPGVLSADPKIVKNARTIKSLTYGEAEEAGKVIHTKAINLVRGKGIKVEVTYIVAPEQKTIIENNVPRKDGAKIISFRDNLYLLIVRGEKMVRPGALFEITKVISQEGINIILIRDTKSKVYLVVERNKSLFRPEIKNSHDFENCERKINGLGYRLSIKEASMVNAIGRMDWKIAERFNQLLYKFCPEAELGAFPYRNCLRLDAIVGRSKVKKLIKIFHKELVL